MFPLLCICSITLHMVLYCIAPYCYIVCYNAFYFVVLCFFICIALLSYIANCILCYCFHVINDGKPEVYIHFHLSLYMFFSTDSQIIKQLLPLYIIWYTNVSYYYNK